MPIARPASFLLISLFALSASAADKPASREDRMFAAGAAWMRSSSQLLLGMISRVDPADCSSGLRAKEWFSVAVEKDKKLMAEYKAAIAGATKEENAALDQRFQTELGPELEAIKKKTEAGFDKLRKFHAACPKEAQELRKETTAYRAQMP